MILLIAGMEDKALIKYAGNSNGIIIISDWDFKVSRSNNNVYNADKVVYYFSRLNKTSIFILKLLRLLSSNLVQMKSYLKKTKKTPFKYQINLFCTPKRFTF